MRDLSAGKLRRFYRLYPLLPVRSRVALAQLNRGDVHAVCDWIVQRESRREQLQPVPYWRLLCERWRGECVDDLRAMPR